MKAISHKEWRMSNSKRTDADYMTDGPSLAAC